MARVIRLWDAAVSQDTPLALLVRTLADAVRQVNPDYKMIEKCAQDISNALGTTGDALPAAEEKLGLTQTQAPATSPSTKNLTALNNFGLEDEVSPQEALIRRVKQWRQIADRGAGGRKFGREVANAYGYRCIFSGNRLPRLEITDSPGVDSAHILPWSTHDLNSVRNGLCLNKQCHWAFDQGILRLAFDQPSNTYVVSLPNSIKKAAMDAAFDLEYFEAMIGPIPHTRLPANQTLWPSPSYLAELNGHLTAI
jgi:hypothetical protein